MITKVFKSFGWVAAIAALFCMSVLAGLMSEGKGPKLSNVASLFKHEQPSGEVASASTGASINLGQGDGNLQAVGEQQGTRLTADSPYFQYIETIKGADVTITRQPIPDDLTGDRVAGLQKMASNIGARQPIATAKHGTAYMLTSQSAQVVVYVYNQQKLVFMQSLTQHGTDDWKTFIDGHGVQ